MRLHSREIGRDDDPVEYIEEMIVQMNKINPTLWESAKELSLKVFRVLEEEQPRLSVALMALLTVAKYVMEEILKEKEKYNDNKNA